MAPIARTSPPRSPRSPGRYLSATGQLRRAAVAYPRGGDRISPEWTENRVGTRAVAAGHGRTRMPGRPGACAAGGEGHPLLRFQRAAGNRAVAERLAGGRPVVQRRLPGPEATSSPAFTELKPPQQAAHAQQLQDMIRGQIAHLPPNVSLDIGNTFFDQGLIISKPVSEYASPAEALEDLRRMLVVVKAKAPTVMRPG